MSRIAPRRNEILFVLLFVLLGQAGAARAAIDACSAADIYAQTSCTALDPLCLITTQVDVVAPPAGGSCTFDFGTQDIEIRAKFRDPNGNGIEILANNITLRGDRIESPAGDIRIEADGHFEIIGNGPAVDVSAGAEGDGGSIEIVAATALLEKGELDASSGGTVGPSAPPEVTADGGEITINVTGLLTVSGTAILVDSGTGDATGGTVEIDAGVLVLQDVIDASGEGGGGGSISISVAGSTTLSSSAELKAQSTGGAGEPGFESGGSGGAIDISSVGDLTIDGDLDVSGSAPDGSAGSIDLSAAAGAISADGDLLANGGGAEGSGGDITIDAAADVDLTGRLELVAGNQSSAGSLNVTSNADITLHPAAVLDSSSGFGGSGISFIALGTVTLSDAIQAAASVGSRGADVVLQGCSVLLDGSIDTSGPADSGDVLIQGTSVAATANADVSASPCPAQDCIQIRTPGAVPLNIAAGTFTPAPLIDESAPIAPCCSNSALDPGESCDDGNRTFCDGCSGQCQSEAAPFNLCPADGDDCTRDQCNPVQGCVYPTEPDETPCDQPGELCTLHECVAGVCTERTPVLSACDDVIECTADPCDGNTGCLAKIPDNLLCEDSTGCSERICDTGLGCIAVDVASLGTPCDNADLCTSADACDGMGSCVGVSFEASGTACDDGNLCTESDSCDGAGSCSGTPMPEGSACDDGDTCTFDRCDAAGQCLSQPVNCLDGDPCTTDSCTANVGCRNVENMGLCAACSDPNGPFPVGTPCVDGDECTVGDTCDGAGSCTPGPPRDCDDGDPCTTDSCSVVPFTFISICRHLDTLCVPGPSLCSDPNTGPVPDGTPCSDTLACTPAGSCQAGVCVTPPIDCDDGDPCNGDEYCVVPGSPFFETIGCRVSHANPVCDCTADQDCSDLNFCTVDSCVGGSCVYTPIDDPNSNCNDFDLCTMNDACIAGQCTGTPIDCNDGDACTNNTCTAGICQSTTLSCDDGNSCTDDMCDTGSGCFYTLNSEMCSMGTGTCAGGTCTGGDPCQGVNCDDGNPCTDDICTAGICSNPPNSDPCDDGNACTTGDTCSAGSCVAGPPLVCDDSNPCTDNSCDTGSGCVFTNNSDPCDDGDACTEPDMCSGGSCTGGPPLDCDDGDICTLDTCDSISGCMNDPDPNAACNDADADGIADALDACTTLEHSSPPVDPPDQNPEKLTLKLKNLHKDPGLQVIVAKGSFNPASGFGDTIDPNADGVHLFLADANGPLLDLSVPGSGGECGPKDGWKVSIKPTKSKWIYKNKSGALPPACVPGSAQGINKVQIEDATPTSQQAFKFTVVVKNTTLAKTLEDPINRLRFSLALAAQDAGGQASPAAQAGQCVEFGIEGMPIAEFPPKPFCKQSFLPDGTFKTVTCKGE